MKKIIVASSLVLITVGIIAFLFFSQDAKDKQIAENVVSNSTMEAKNISNSAIEEDIVTTLNGILECEFDEIYAHNKYKVPFTINNPGSTMYPLIFKKVSYEITGIDEANNNATILFKCPDMYAVVDRISQKYTAGEISKDNALDILEVELSNATMTEKEVTVNLEMVDKHWYIIIDGYFIDAITGGVISSYSDTQYDGYQNMLTKAE